MHLIAMLGEAYNKACEACSLGGFFNFRPSEIVSGAVLR